MTPNRHDVATAKARIETSRARLFGTLAQVQTRLKPANLAQDAVDGAVHGVASVARKSVEAVRARPFAAAGIVGAIGLFMARGWIGSMIAGRDETQRADTGLKSKGARRPKKGSSK